MSSAQAPAPDLLAQAKAGDQDACQQAIIQNAGLIWSIVRRYYGRGVEADDLYQLGCLGFLKAIQGFDSAYGTQFSTYAVPKIAGEIRRFLRDDGTVKVSRSLKERHATVRAAAALLGANLGREPTLSELSAQTGLAPEDIASAQMATQSVASLQGETADGLTLESMLGTPGPEEELVERVALQGAIQALETRERKVILLRYYRSMTQSQCAQLLGVSQVQVSRIEKRALEHLRQLLA